MFRNHFAKILILLLFPEICIAGNIACIDIHDGIFKVRSLDGSLHTIIRTLEKQTEISGSNGVVKEYDIDWLSDCTYMLFNGRVVNGIDSMFLNIKDDTLINEITEVTKMWHKIRPTINEEPSKIELNLFKIDTSTLYRDLNQLEKFKEYTGASGGTLVGYNYVATFLQHSIDTNKFVFAFEEALPFGETSKFKLLDSVHFTIDCYQQFTTTNCRYNGKYDKEIVAVYCSDKADEDADIIKAWRFNKLTLKIEEVQTERVKYTVADRKRSAWD
jgi:hypothetical protein